MTAHGWKPQRIGPVIIVRLGEIPGMPEELAPVTLLAVSHPEAVQHRRVPVYLHDATAPGLMREAPEARDLMLGFLQAGDAIREGRGE